MNDVFMVELVGFATDDPDNGHTWNVVDYTWSRHGRVVDTCKSETIARAVADGLEKARDRILDCA